MPTLFFLVSVLVLIDLWRDLNREPNVTYITPEQMDALEQSPYS